MHLIVRLYDRAEAWLRGWPSAALSLVLVVLAVVLLYLAWRGTVSQKAIAAAWVVLP